MNEWAVLYKGVIQNVITADSTKTKDDLSFMAPGPDYSVELLDDLPNDVKEKYRYWNERP